MRLLVALVPWMFAALTVPAPASDTSPGVTFYPHVDESMADLPFSEAVRAGNLLFLSGQVGVEPGTGELVEGGIRPEARRTMENIRSTLERHGHQMDDVVKCTVMLADIDEWPAFNEVYRSFFEEPYPARSAFAASGLALDARVEVDCIAAVSNGGG